MAFFECVHMTSIEWDEKLKNFPDRTLHQTSAWLSFVAETQNAEPVHGILRERNYTLGYFTGLVFRRSGIKILGSPFPGWATPYMGLNLLAGVPRRIALDALLPFAFQELKCAHFEMRDRYLALEDFSGLGFEHSVSLTSVVDLTPCEDELFSTMTSSCRRALRKAVKMGVVVEEAQPVGFAEEYYAQLKQVFASQSLVPTYGIERVHRLIKHLYPAGMLLLLRARDTGGRCIATGIFPGGSQEMHFWGGASLSEYQSLRPNDAIHWYAMRYWKKRGARFYDPGGTAPFKSKFGGRPFSIFTLRKSKHRLLSLMRDFAKHAVKTRQQLLGRWETISAGMGAPRSKQSYVERNAD